MASKETDCTETAHYENSPKQNSMSGYTGDHVTTKTSRSPVEKSLVLKAGCLFTTLSALVYFVAYLVCLLILSISVLTSPRIETALGMPESPVCRRASVSPTTNTHLASACSVRHP